MADASTAGNMSPQLLKVMERAKQEPEGRFHSLAHLIDVSALERAFHRLRKEAAAGVDGVTKEAYGEALAANLADLYERLRSKRYRHQALRRGYIPKGKGQWRPIGISALEDKIVQDAVREVLERDDAERVLAVLGQRMERYGLTLHPNKTRLIAFARPPVSQRAGKGPNTFDFLGFTCYWRRTRQGRWMMWCKTRHARLRRSKETVAEWCRRHRHLPVVVQHAALTRRLVGHFHYFGVNGNYRSLAILVRATERTWFKWLCRRSQRTRLTWERYQRLLQRFPLPQPRITVRLWGASP